MATKLHLMVLRSKKEFRKCGETREDDDSLRVEKLQRKELLVLTREFRRLQQGDVVLCQHDASTSNSKSSKFVRMNHMLNDLEDIKLQLHLATDTMWMRTAEWTHKQSNEFLQRYLNQVEVMEYLMYNVRMAGKAVDAITQGLLKYHLKLHKMFKVSISRQDYDKKIQHLETLLDGFTQRYGKRSVMNAQLRREITTLLNERLLFFLAHQSLRHSLIVVKEKQNKIVHKSYTCYEIIENARDRRLNLVKVNEHDSRAHAQNMREQNRIVDDFCRFHNFNEIKNKRRHYISTGDSRKKRREAALNDFYNKALSDYKHSFKLILHIVGAITNDSVLYFYKKYDEINFVLFRYNNDINMENSWLQNEIEKLNDKNEELQSSTEDRESYFARRIKSYQIYLDLDNRVLAHLKYYLSKKEEDMKSIVKYIDAVFETSGAEKTAVMELLGNKHKWILRPRHFVFIISVIDTRIRKLLAHRENLLSLKDKRNRSPSSQSQGRGAIDRRRLPSRSYFVHHIKTHGGPFVPRVNLSALRQLTAEDDDEDKVFAIRPITKSEMRKRCREAFDSSGISMQQESLSQFATTSERSLESKDKDISEIDVH